MDLTTVIIIPARYKSVRYEGKPLVPLAGKLAIQRTYEAALMVRGKTAVYVATDDARIRDAVERFGGAVLMTSEHCRNGTERVAEAAAQLAEPADLVINLQGDAPLTPAWFVEALVEFMAAHPQAEMATPVLKCSAASYANFIDDRRHARVGATTVVFDSGGRALYFSKEVIPFLPQVDLLDQLPVYHHVGLYAYRPAALQAYLQWPMGPLESAEQLEQLRFLEQSRSVYVVEVDGHGREFWELNNPEDVPRIEQILRAQGK